MRNFCSGLVIGIQALLVAQKLAGAIDWRWLFVLAPLELCVLWAAGLVVYVLLFG